MTRPKTKQQSQKPEYPLLCARCDSPLNLDNAMSVPITEHGVPVDGVDMLVCVGCFPDGPIERDWRMDDAIDGAEDE